MIATKVRQYSHKSWVSVSYLFTINNKNITPDHSVWTLVFTEHVNICQQVSNRQCNSTTNRCQIRVHAMVFYIFVTTNMLMTSVSKKLLWLWPQIQLPQLLKCQMLFKLAGNYWMWWNNAGLNKPSELQTDTGKYMEMYSKLGLYSWARSLQLC